MSELKNNNNLGKSNFTYMFLLLMGGILIALFFIYNNKDSLLVDNKIDYSEFLDLLSKENEIDWVNIFISGRDLTGRFIINKSLSKDKATLLKNKYQNYKLSYIDTYEVTTYSPTTVSHEFVNMLHKKGILFEAKPKQRNYIQELLIQFIPFIVIIFLLWFFVFRQISSPGNKAMSFGKSKAKIVKHEFCKVRFDDVAGVDEAKEELVEVVNFLKNPEKFKKIGAKIPKGFLLVGEPGSGKTLLSKAVAGEASCPFFNMSGSDFVEMFVGVGASRVRDLFEQARNVSPCIIFIDELDAVGRMRGNGYGGGHDEREQTLNQMLVEMDGFNSSDNIIVIAATNRPDVLDKALLRPGRFDRRVSVSLPDIKGREEILRIHIKNIKQDNGINLYKVAQGTVGFSGADLANLVNEAAIYAVKMNRDKIIDSDLDFAKDKVMMGPERKSMILNESERKITAYHEAGHAVLSVLLEKNSNLYKVTIVPRGSSLGGTHIMPDDDKLVSKKDIINNIIVLYGGRVAEEVIYDEQSITTGASNDIERATKLATRYVCEWGMSSHSSLRGVKYDYTSNAYEQCVISSDTRHIIESEVSKILNACQDKAFKLIENNLDKLKLIADSLCDKEVLSRRDVLEIMNNKSAA